MLIARSALFAAVLSVLPPSAAQAQYYTYPPCTPNPLSWPFCVAGAAVGTAAAIATAPFHAAAGGPYYDFYGRPYYYYYGQPYYYASGHYYPARSAYKKRRPHRAVSARARAARPAVPVPYNAPTPEPNSPQ